MTHSTGAVQLRQGNASSASPPPAPLNDQDVFGLKRGLNVWAEHLLEETEDGKTFGDQVAADRWAAAVSRWIIDATLLADIASLQAALEIFRRAALRLRPTGPTARLEALVTALAETARAGLDRARQTHVAETLDPNSWAARMLLLVHANPHITSSDIVDQLGAHEAQISRSGKALVERGLIIKTRHGRAKGWHTTPLGNATVQRLLARESDAS